MASSLNVRITGSIVNAYFICPRKAWLMSRQISPDEDYLYLHLGRLIQEQAYSREKKEVHLDHLCIDVIKKEGETLVIGEVKKSSRGKGAARMQLVFYLYELRSMGIEAKGKLLFPEERKGEEIILDEKWALKIEKVKQEIGSLVQQLLPPPPCWSSYCSKCAYAELCWA